MSTSSLQTFYYAYATMDYWLEQFPIITDNLLYTELIGTMIEIN